METKSPTQATDPELMQDLGRRLAALRVAQRLTMLEVAARTGLSRRTVHRAEAGRNPTLLTLLRLLRLYGRLDALSAFVPAPVVSPMAELLATKAPRRRRSRG